MAKIAFIGLGHMGKPMVLQLLHSNHDVCVYDLRPEAIDSLVIAGARAANDIKSAVQDCEVIFTMLQTGEQVSQCCLAEDGIFNHMPTGAIYIDCSSIDVHQARDIHQAAAKRDIAMCDAPVSGGVKGAEEGLLTFMVGGDPAHFTRAKPFLASMAKRVVYAGAAGNGQAAKVCNNMVLAVSMIAISEAFQLGEKLGLDAAVFYEIANNASAQCWALSHYCPVPGIMADVPASHDYQPGFSASMMLKDLRLSQSAAERVGFQTVLGAQATSIYQRFVMDGHAAVDFSAIYQAIRSDMD